MNAGYKKMLQQVIWDTLDRFPDAGNRTIARVLAKEHPELFHDIECARMRVRYYRGVQGSKRLQSLKNKKYVRQPI